MISFRVIAIIRIRVGKFWQWVDIWIWIVRTGASHWLSV